MEFILSRATTVEAQWAGAPVQRAVARFRRDLEMTLCQKLGGIQRTVIATAHNTLRCPIRELGIPSLRLQSLK